MLARLVADGLAIFLVRDSVAWTAFSVVDQTRHVLFLGRLDELLLEHRTPERIGKVVKWVHLDCIGWDVQ